MARSEKSLLDTVDWDFSQRPGDRGIHDIHPYPARFIPELPRNLIRLFHPGDKSLVMDPFCGSGTTLVEAAAVGLPSLGVDLNPIATLIAKVKMTRPSEPLWGAARAVLASVSQDVEVPNIPRLEHWFSIPAQRALARLTAGIDGVRDPATQDALRVALSRIVVRVSNQDSDTRYAAVPNSITEEAIYSAFLKSARDVEERLSRYQSQLPDRSPIDSSVITQDILTVAPEDVQRPVGLVVTSPPYPNAYEYWLYHKYRMYWMGMDPIAVRKAEIGARAHYFKKNHQTEHDFERQMCQVFSLIAAVLVPDGYACFVIGRSLIHGRVIDNVALLERAAGANGLRLVARTSRRIPRNRKSFNLSHAAIDSEVIAVFRR